MSIITRYGGAAIAPAKSNAFDIQPASEWRFINSSIVSGGVDSVPDTGAAGLGNTLYVFTSSRPTMSGNVATINANNRGLYVPAMNFPAGTKDITFIAVCISTQSFTSGQTLIELAPPHLTNPDGASIAKTFGGIEARMSVPSGVKNSHTYGTYNEFDNSWQTLAATFNRTAGSDAVRLYRNGILMPPNYTSALPPAGVIPNGLRLNVGAASAGDKYWGGSMTVLRMYAGYLTAAQILAASTETYNQNIPSP